MRGLSTILHCLQWYKLLLRTRLPTAAVQYPMHKHLNISCNVKVQASPRRLVVEVAVEMTEV